MKFDRLVMLAVVICAIVLAGELMAYGPNVQNYDADAEMEDGMLSISVSSSGPDAYSAIVMDNGEYPSPTQLYIYLDERYGETFAEARDAIGLKGLDIEYSIEQVRRSLNVRGFDDIVICGDDRLLEMLEGGAGSKALLVMSYALPESVYSGSADDPIFEWVRQGGALYWMASPIGMFYRGESGLVEVKNSGEILFGKDCINTAGADLALSVLDAGGLTNALSLKWNRVLYGLDASGTEGSLSMGFSQDGYASVSMVPFGSGMICVFGGNYERNQCDDVAQVIASGISCYSQILNIGTGTVVRDTAEMSFEMPDGAADISVYVSIGGYYTVFGRIIRC